MVGGWVGWLWLVAGWVGVLTKMLYALSAANGSMRGAVRASMVVDDDLS